MSESVQHVSDTAFWVAHYRAVESKQPDALFRDPLAATLAGVRGEKIAADMPAAQLTGWLVVVRTCIIDELIRTAVAAGVDTVCNIGAGLDTRPYRMDLPSSLQWIEVDFGHMIEFKNQTLANEKPRVQLERFAADLTNPSVRNEVFATVNKRAKKLLVLSEGVVPYLSEADAGSLADELRKLDRLAYWILEYTSPQWQHMRSRSIDRKLAHAPLQFRPSNWQEFFARHGFRPKDIRYYLVEAEKLGRPMPFTAVQKLVINVRSLFMSREKRESWRKFGGYALLEPS